MTYPTDLEKVYHVRYSTYNNWNVDFIEDENGKWEFDDRKEATALYIKTVESKEHEWVFLTKTLKMDEDEFKELYPDDYYPDLFTVCENILEGDTGDETDKEDEEESEEDKDFTEKWFMCATKEERLELLATAFDNK